MTISPHLPSIDRALFRGMTISHYSYAVEDIAEAVLHWTTLLGAGPFFIMDPVVLDRVTTRDEQEAEWAHSAASGSSASWSGRGAEPGRAARGEPRVVRQRDARGGQRAIQRGGARDDHPRDVGALGVLAPRHPRGSGPRHGDSSWVD
jgi:hypothetical protein